MALRISDVKLRSILKSPYLIYPAGILALILIYTGIFLMLPNEFNPHSRDVYTAIYWVVVTMTTTGLGDIYPVTVMGKLFTMLVILSGIAIFFAVVLPLMITPSIERWIKSPKGKPPERLKGHVIICGYNALVDSLITELADAGKPLVIIDESSQSVHDLQLRGFYAISGDSTDEKTLKIAQVDKASTLIANEGEDKDAAVVLTASQMSGCKIIALVERLDLAEYLKYAGADIVISPKQILGINMGMTAISSINFEVTNVVDLGEDMKICKLPVYPDNPMVGKKLKELGIREKTGANIVGAFKDGKFIINPPADMEVDEATVLMAIGNDRQLHDMSDMGRIVGQVCGGKRIIAGYGDVGREVAKQFDKRGISYTIIDLKPHEGLEQVVGDSTDQETLKKAGIADASTIVVTLNDDNKNLLTVLLARNMNRHVNIIARANLDNNVSKIYRAGADYVTSLSTTGGQIMARVVEKGVFEDTVILSENVLLYKFHVKGSALEGKAINETEMRSKTGCSIVGVIDAGRFTPNPEPSLVLSQDSIILTIGTYKQLEACAAAYSLKKAIE
ncbi:MAG TPA: NAD-binding protein [Methanocella sp.]|uniref:potassium channel family protein n=1 Tax=Methanocella sp. TaxID=2052833 RepID=UPI002C695E90|nr:NAD-binding protein [Methanocella sp.]HTY90633.1 NAD-binding protein [Methanocella sp.]